MLLRAVISNCCLSSGESESIANEYGQQVDNLLLERGGPFGPQHSSEHCAVNILGDGGQVEWGSSRGNHV